MKASGRPQAERIAGFRVRLLVWTMLLVTAVTLLALWLGQRRLAASVGAELARGFEGEFAALEHAQAVRHAALVERCRALVRKPRIHAALEDDALDLLYLSAEDELRDILARPGGGEAGALQATFYRFLDRNGALIVPDDERTAGRLEEPLASRLALPGVSRKPQLGYLPRAETAPGELGIVEVLAMPIISTENAEVIAALVLGFPPFAAAERAAPGRRRGIAVDGAWHGLALTPAEAEELARARPVVDSAPREVALAGRPHLVFTRRLNPDSHYAPAHEVCLYSLEDLAARQRQLRWQVLGAGTLLLLVGLAGSQVLSARLAAPVERLAVTSATDRAERVKAEAALETTSAELQRSARFSADASHQLKTPVTVLRAGLEELLAHPRLTAEECDQISALIHQTYRLSSLIEDLLLLSRLDAGRLTVEFARVDLTRLIEAALDDLSAWPDDLGLEVETEVAAGLEVTGEARYLAMILQNLLENARKYNERGGRIRVRGRREGARVVVAVGNTGPGIAAAARAHVFERFHRGQQGEDVPGHGLGLNLARELARLHGGDLRLVGSDVRWTEFHLELPGGGA